MLLVGQRQEAEVKAGGVAAALVERHGLAGGGALSVGVAHPGAVSDATTPPKRAPMTSLLDYEAALDASTRERKGCFAELMRNLRLWLRASRGGTGRRTAPSGRGRARRRMRRGSKADAPLARDAGDAPGARRGRRLVRHGGGAEGRLEKLRRGLSALTAPVRRAVNTWHHYAVERREQKDRIAAALRRMSPEGAAMLKALTHMRDLVSENQRKRRAVMGFINHSSVMAINKWVRLRATRSRGATR